MSIKIIISILVLVHLPYSTEHQQNDVIDTVNEMNDGTKIFSEDVAIDELSDVNNNGDLVDDEILRHDPRTIRRTSRRRGSPYISCLRLRQTRCRWVLFRSRWYYFCPKQRIRRCF